MPEARKEDRLIASQVTVLVVDDEPEFRHFMAAELKHHFGTVLSAANGKEALELFMEHRPQVILTDLSMPKMDGMELARAIREIDHTLYIAAVTASEDLEMLQRAIHVGFDDYLIKPLSSEQFDSMIQNATAKVELHLRLERQRMEMEEAYEMADICSFYCHKGELDAPLVADRFLDAMFGCDHHTLTAQEFFERHIRPEELDRFLAKREAFLSQQEHGEFEVGMRRSDGTPLEVLIKCKCEQNEDGTLRYSRAIIKNITSLRHSEQQAAHREKELSLLLDTIPDGAWAWNLQENTLYLTPRWKQMLGYEDHELPNHPDTFFMRLHPEDLPVVQKEVERHLKRESDLYEVRFRLLCKDGSWKWIKAHGRVIFDCEGNPHKFLGLHEDLGNELRAEKAEGEVAIYEKIVSSTRDPLSFLDRERHYRAVNTSYLAAFGKRREEIIGKAPWELLGEESYEQIIKPHLDACFHGETVCYSDWFEWPSGKHFLQVTYIPYWKGDQVEGVVVNVHDQTKWQQAQEQLLDLTNTLEVKVKEKVEELRQKDQLMIQQGRFAAMGEMLSMIAHQWRQPLNAVSVASINMKLFSEMGELDEEAVRTQCDFIGEQAQKMSQTINDFMGFFKPGSGTSLFVLAECLESVQKMMEAQLRLREINLQVKVDRDIKLLGVKNEMEHVLLNLISNARDVLEERAPRKKVIRVEAEDTGSTIRLSIADTGGGIPHEIMEKIFDPYFTTKESSKGSGIGLYMAKTIITQHFGGTIDIHNTEEGALFTITLPKKDDHA